MGHRAIWGLVLGMGGGKIETVREERESLCVIYIYSNYYYPLILSHLRLSLSSFPGLYMSCIYDITSYRLPGRYSYEGWYCWGSEVKKGDFRFWIESDAWRVSLCFRSLYIANILWN